MRGEDRRAPADEPLSPELVLVCPELRQRALELEAARKVVVEPPRAVGQAPPSRSRLRLVVSVSTLALSLAGASVSVGRPSTSVPLAPPAPVVAAIALRDATALGPRVSVRAGKELASFVQPSPSRRVEPRVHTKPELGPQLLPPRIPHPQVDLAAAESELEPVSNLLGPLPDPTPRPLRLSPGTARTILAGARLRRVDWALLAAELRATASDWPHPSAWRIRFVANRLARHRDAADLEPLVIAQYDRAVGIDSLISGLEGARSVLASQVLRDPRISIYRDGQRDVSAGRVDVRVLALLLFLARRTGEVTVSSLVTGHSEPLGGGRSSHDFGAAVELTSLGGRPVADEQEPGGYLERLIRALQLLPQEVRPKHVTSLLDLGSGTFALPEYRDHVQISFDPTQALPDRLYILWQLAGSRYGVPWRVLAAINEIESNFGRNMGPSSAGAVGWMQFLPSTWSRWGVDANGDGRRDPADPADAIFSAARYLAAAGAESNLRGAIFAYNHADWYVNDVLRLASRFD